MDKKYSVVIKQGTEESGYCMISSDLFASEHYANLAKEMLDEVFNCSVGLIFKNIKVEIQSTK